jgi:hypothetical protein
LTNSDKKEEKMRKEPKILNNIGTVLSFTFALAFSVIFLGLSLFGLGMVFQSIHIMVTEPPSAVLVEDLRAVHYEPLSEVELPNWDNQRYIDLEGGFGLFIGEHYISGLNLVFVKHEEGIFYSGGVKRLGTGDIMKKEWRFWPLGLLNMHIKKATVKPQPGSSQVRIEVTSRPGVTYFFLVVAIVIGIVFGWFGGGGLKHLIGACLEDIRFCREAKNE